MRFGDLFGRRRSARTAQHRLQVLLMHERIAGSTADLIPVLRDEILAVLAKYMTVDLDKVQVKVERGDVVSLLEIDIEIPALARLMLERRTGPFYVSQPCPR
jgi:cell division topological specificity factor